MTSGPSCSKAWIMKAYDHYNLINDFSLFHMMHTLQIRMTGCFLVRVFRSAGGWSVCCYLPQEAHIEEITTFWFIRILLEPKTMQNIGISLTKFLIPFSFFHFSFFKKSLSFIQHPLRSWSCAERLLKLVFLSEQREEAQVFHLVLSNSPYKSSGFTQITVFSQKSYYVMQ